MGLKDTKRCRAKNKRTGEQCKQPAVLGRPVCRFHGGTGGRPIVHGLRSKELPVKLEEQRQQLIDNREALLSLEPLIASLKIRLNRFEELKEEAGGSWSEGDIKLLTDTSEAISKIIERYHKIELAVQAGIPRAQVKCFINRLIIILTEELNANQLESVKIQIQKAAVETMPI